jgi:hypothetical protein
MKIGDLVRPSMGHPTLVGLVIGEGLNGYNGALLRVLWPDKAHPMWEPKQYLELISGGSQ